MKWVHRIVLTAVIFVAIFFLAPTVWSMIIADPLPQSVRTKFNAIGDIGRTARSSKSAFHPTGTSAQSAQDAYQYIRERFDLLIDKAIEGLTVNRIDESYLDAELTKLVVLAGRFRREARYDHPVGNVQPRACDIPEEVKQTFDHFLEFANSAMKDWRGLVVKREELKKTTIEQLKSFRWPPWAVT